MEKKILHRGISINNILMYPNIVLSLELEGATRCISCLKDRFSSLMTCCRLIRKSNLHVTNNVLIIFNSRSSYSGPLKSDTARCLIIDFDNSSLAHDDLISGFNKQNKSDVDAHGLKSADARQDLRERKGTPIFISRSAALGKTLNTI